MLANAYEEHGRELESHQVCRIFYGNSADNDNAASLIYSLFTIVYFFFVSSLRGKYYYVEDPVKNPGHSVVSSCYF